MRLTNIHLLVLLAFCWGPSFLFIKLALAELDPIMVSIFRIGTGALILNLILLLKRNYFFHFGQVSNFKAFYSQYVCVHLNDLFPDLVSYQRFVASKKKIAVPLMMFLKTRGLGKCRGISFMASTHLKVCHNRRIHQHKPSKKLLKEAFALLDGSMSLSCI